jgi:response regulator RpfG family c-di-GMP phosphodiesterase
MKKFKILIADDEEELRDIYEIILEGSFHCEIFKANDGQEAIQLLSESNDFDLVITDYNMPNINGGALFNFIKKNGNIPIILISGGDLQDYSDLVGFKLANPHNQFIIKPFDENQIINSVASVFNSFTDKPNPITLETSEFIKVKLKHFFKYSQSSAEVYINIHGNKFTKIIDLDKSNLPEQNLLEHYLKKNVEYIYVKPEYYLQLVLENIQTLKKNIELKKAPKDILKIAGLQFHVSLSGLESIGVTPLQVELVSELIEQTILEISKDSYSAVNLKKICEEEGFLIGHSILIMFIAGSICKETQLNYSATMSRLCLAAFFHDFSLNEFELGPYELNLSKIEDEKIFQKIIDHPVQSAKFLPNVKEVTDDTKKIILEHHEMPNGDGYPKKLNANQISPLSCIFIMAQQISFCLLRNDYQKSRLKDFLKNNEIIFKQGNFTKFYNIAVTKFT